MTSLGRSQIVAAPGPEACGTTELPSRQPRPLRAAGTAGCAPSVAALAVCVAREAWLTPKPRQNDARSHRGVGLIIKTLALFTNAARASIFVRTTYAGERADVRITPRSACQLHRVVLRQFNGLSAKCTSTGPDRYRGYKEEHGPQGGLTVFKRSATWN